MTGAATHIATRRFGLGPKPGDVARIGRDPRGYVEAQLGNPSAAQLDKPGLDAAHTILAEVLEAQRRQRMAALAMAEAGQQPQPPGGQTGVGEVRREHFNEDAAARIERCVSTEQPLVERLVGFWSNHFAVSVQKPHVRAIAGAFEREAIRPHVLGRFADMLLAVQRHPAMLIYLDNTISIGPESRVGRIRKRGLNENLAREILELHTLGVDGGYTQADVTNLARLLTGWTVGGLGQEWIEPGRFLFTPNRHEPGRWRVLDTEYGGRGELSAKDALAALARHPATSRHIASKLARHFVADRPEPALVERLARAFRDSDGDLLVLTRALVSSDAAWNAPVRRIVPPLDFVVGLARGFTLKATPREMVRLAGILGQPLWQPPSPKGWPDGDDAWLGPSNIRERLRIAERISGEVGTRADPRALGEDLLGAALSETTRRAIARADSREQGIGLLAMAPEMQRR